MEEVLQRFGHIGDQIFEELDSQTLSRCGFIGRSWNSFLDQGKVRPFRIIETYTNIDKKYLRNRKKKINVEKANELADTVRKIYRRFPKRTGNVNPQKISGRRLITPLHYAAERGHLLLCELIIDNLDDKNPKGDWAKTPLHHATENGHFEICKLIIDNVDDKNPKCYQN